MVGTTKKLQVDEDTEYTLPAADGDNRDSLITNGSGTLSFSPITASDVGLGNVTNESKATMFTDAALTGDSTAVTQSASDNSTKIATTAYVDAAAGGGGSAVHTFANQTEVDAYSPTPGDTLIITVATALDFSAHELRGVTVNCSVANCSVTLGHCYSCNINIFHKLYFAGQSDTEIYMCRIRANYIYFKDVEHVIKCELEAYVMYFGTDGTTHEIDSSDSYMMFSYCNIFVDNCYLYGDVSNDIPIRFVITNMTVQSVFYNVSHNNLIDYRTTLLIGSFNGASSPATAQLWVSDDAWIRCLGNTSGTDTCDIYNDDGTTTHHTGSRGKDEEFSLRNGTWNDTSIHQ